MKGTAGIVAYGAYIPRLRLARKAIADAHAWAMPALKSMAQGERAFASWDEDSITMAVEAGRDALQQEARGQMTGVTLASTTLPFIDRQNAAIVGTALNLPDTVATLDVTGSMRAGTSALATALGVAAGAGGRSLVVAAERRQAKPASTQEMQYGDGAAALVVGGEGVIARLIAQHTLARDFVDHFRAEGQKHDYVWEERWVRDEGYMKIVPEAIQGLLRKTNVPPAAITRFVLPTTIAGVSNALAKRLDLPAASVVDTLAKNCGDTGTAHSLLMLVAALEQAKPGDHILVAAFGNGCDALLFEVTPEIAKFKARRAVAGSLARKTTTSDYLRLLSFNDEVALDWGMRAEFGIKYAMTTEYRASRDMLGFVGGRDRRSGTVQFPKTPVSVNPDVHSVGDMEDVPLADCPAHIVSHTADWLNYHPSPPFYFGLAQFENGARVLMEFVDVEEGTLAVGAPLEMVFRIKEIDRRRGYRNYFWKAVPRKAKEA